ncbi:MAG: Mannose-6-phosphate isomerase, class I [uncultured bacterium]|nr:MAG: Mannose-6-phosphate isomerase, class I [uncultured bacterium]
MKFDKPIKLLPNICVEKSGAVSGYNWGKEPSSSNILKTLNSVSGNLSAQNISIGDNDLIAERWIVSDDRENPSFALIDGKFESLFSVLEKWAKNILGETHFLNFGHYIGTIMKLLDTNNAPLKGSLSVQVHPKFGYSKRPSKPEMWKGKGRIYIGWKCDMTEDAIKEAVHNNSLEDFLNSVEINEDNLVIVPGGTVHAIRYGTFIHEWSKSITEEDSNYKTLKNATIALYDRTDGKTPRLNKENIECSLDVMKHADKFKKITDFFVNSKTINEEPSGNSIRRLFNTKEVIVDEYTISSSIDINTNERGFPIYLESGKLNVLKDGKIIDVINKGEERLFPQEMRDVILNNISDSKSVLYKWYRPF